MSKGSNFWGTARGKLGNMVISSVKGQQVERKYQPMVANPKTFAQMRQRAIFASAVKFFKHSQQNLFKFAFEDKTQKESDYNAFMRHNVKWFTPQNKVATDNPTLPALGFYLDLQLSFGTLPSADSVQFLDLDTQQPKLAFWVNPIHDETAQTKYTWGEVSKALIKYYGLVDGDIITFVVVDCHMPVTKARMILNYGEEAELARTPPSWILDQVKVDSTSTEDVSTQVRENNKFFITPSLSDFTEKDLLLGSVIFSRNIKGRSLMVSTSNFVSGTEDEYSDIIVTEDSPDEQQILLTWGANPGAVLKGSLL